MPRHARKISSTGIYHLIIRGINKEPIFLEDEDRHRFLETLLRVSVDANATILGYCLMDNHVKTGGRLPRLPFSFRLVFSFLINVSWIFSDSKCHRGGLIRISAEHPG